MLELILLYLFAWVERNFITSEFSSVYEMRYSSTDKVDHICFLNFYFSVCFQYFQIKKVCVSYADNTTEPINSVWSLYILFFMIRDHADHVIFFIRIISCQHPSIILSMTSSVCFRKMHYKNKQVVIYPLTALNHWSFHINNIQACFTCHTNCFKWSLAFFAKRWTFIVLKNNMLISVIKLLVCQVN